MCTAKVKARTTKYKVKPLLVPTSSSCFQNKAASTLVGVFLWLLAVVKGHNLEFLSTQYRPPITVIFRVDVHHSVVKPLPDAALKLVHNGLQAFSHLGWHRAEGYFMPGYGGVAGHKSRCGCQWRFLQPGLRRNWLSQPLLFEGFLCKFGAWPLFSPGGSPPGSGQGIFFRAVLFCTVNCWGLATPKNQSWFWHNSLEEVTWVNFGFVVLVLVLQDLYNSAEYICWLCKINCTLSNFSCGFSCRVLWLNREDSWFR